MFILELEVVKQLNFLSSSECPNVKPFTLWVISSTSGL